MDVRSLGLRTELMFHRWEGEVVDRGAYLAIRTPDNPTYRWGNYLLFDRPPSPGDAGPWIERFHAEIGCPPDIPHVTFSWDEPTGAVGHIESFLERGFRLRRDAVLVAEQLTAAPPDRAGLEVRTLESDADWNEAVDLQVRCRDDDEPEEGYRTFRTRKMRGYRRLQDEGHGFWLGGFVQGRMVADLGLFARRRLGRFQHVETDPEYRRLGIARRMVHEAGLRGTEMLGVERLVVVADPDYHAIDLYRSLGFEGVELMTGLELSGEA